MAPSTIRKAIGAVKDQTSIGIAKVSSNMAPELEVAIVKATSHDDEPASEKHIREILHLTSYSRSHVSACVSSISKRIGKTRDWIVAIKCLMLIQRLLSDGDPVFQQEIMYSTRRGTRLLNMSDFRDEAHSNSWDYSSFVRTLAMYLDQKLELICYERKLTDNGTMEIERYNSRDDQRWRSPPNRSYDYDYNNNNNGIRRSRSSGDVKENSSSDHRKDITPLREMKPERIFGKMSHLQRLLNRFLSCRPTSMAKNSRMVLVALYPIVKESFKIYADICEILAVLLDRFFDMDYQDCVKAFDAYASAAKQIDELVGFYNWCKDTGLARSSEYPEVQTITGKLLETLEEFVRDRANSGKSPERKEIQSSPQIEETPEILALPPPENFTPPPQPEPELPIPEPPPKPADLLDLRDDSITADDQGNKFALALFSGDTFANSEPTTTSAWQNLAAELGKADWELALVESASNLSNQKADLGGGLDPLLLNGMYDQGMVRQYNSTAQMSGGSASSVILPGPGSKSKTQVLALPAPDGTTEKVGQDPFEASLSFAPPSYVQMSDMEKKQQLLLQEQMVWDQYARNGMQGQSSLTRIAGGGFQGGGYQAPGNMMPYGMPTVAGYYYNTQY